MPHAQQAGLKPSHKLVQACYSALAQFDQHHVTRETAVRQPFLDLLRAAAGQRGWSLEPEFPCTAAAAICLGSVHRLLDARLDAEPIGHFRRRHGLKPLRKDLGHHSLPARPTESLAAQFTSPDVTHSYETERQLRRLARPHRKRMSGSWAAIPILPFLSSPRQKL